MKIRKIEYSDCKELYEWRNDPVTKSMSKESDNFNYQTHIDWFKKSILDPNIIFFMGECKDGNIGVCRFDFDLLSNDSQISININPDFRGRGLGKKLLSKSIEIYKKNHDCNLKAIIKIKNTSSIRLFSDSGFYIYEKNKEFLKMKYIKKLIYKKVDINDSKVLYQLLKKREFSISHKILPSYEIHKLFVASNPYEHWYIFAVKENVLGSFYIKDDNSIGINLNNPTKSLIKYLIDHILKNFTPKEEVASFIPNYFYMNISPENKELINILKDLGLLPIQITFKIKR